MYIVIEGQDATGKSTQVEMLATLLKQQNKTVVTLHEPDGELNSTHALRDLIKNKDYNLDPLTHVLLFTAARLELWRKLAEPTLKSGGIVISARNWWSTLAYQGYGQGISLDKITKITKNILPKSYTAPTHSVILTLDDETRLKRQFGRDDKSQKDTFESKPNDFQEKVNRAYERIAKDFSIPTIDASPSESEIQSQILSLFGL